MMQSPQLIHALARQSDRIAPPKHIIDRETVEPAPIRNANRVAESRMDWLWHMLFWRRRAAAS